MVYTCLLVSVWFSMSVCVLITVWVWISVSVTACLYDLNFSPTSSLPLLSDIKHLLLSLFPPWSRVSTLCQPGGSGRVLMGPLLLPKSTGFSFPSFPVILCLTLPQSSFLLQCGHASVLCGNHSKITIVFFNKWINRLVCKRLYFSLNTYSEALSIPPLLLSAYQAHGVLETRPA